MADKLIAFKFEDATGRVFVSEGQNLPRYLRTYMQAGIKHSDTEVIQTEKARFWRSRPLDQKPPLPF